MISLLSKNPIPESLDSKSSDNRKASNSSKTNSIKDDINPSPEVGKQSQIYHRFTTDT